MFTGNLFYRQGFFGRYRTIIHTKIVLYANNPDTTGKTIRPAGKEVASMNKQQEGIVISVTGDLAKVRTSRHSDCENCGSCPGTSAIVLDARNPLAARPGQRVMIEVQEVGLVKSAFVVYFMPLLALFGGAMAGDYAAARLGQEALLFQVAGACLAFAVSLAYIKFVDRRAGRNTGLQPVIVSIITD